ncbi:HD domain-containing protein [Rhizobium sp. YTU87027]|uniref:HD domain-containing protein n=1 Tax=Rhizobium sp. YTU87027 TaxID=3417741 RepID=UPI003D6989CF
MGSGRPGRWDEQSDPSGLLRAIKIAFNAHAGQTDKTGEPYFSHCKRVADAVEGEDARILAYLHDVVEKGPGWTLERLRNEGFSFTLIDAVDALTKRADEDDREFVTRIASNDLACPVKVADLKDNLSQAEKVGSDPSKYEEGLKIIKEMCADGTAKRE